MLGKFSRRHFCEACEFSRGWSGVGACEIGGVRGLTKARHACRSQLPERRLLGAATTAYQIEGAVHRRVPE
jgi:hypothetical protein